MPNKRSIIFMIIAALCMSGCNRKEQVIARYTNGNVQAGRVKLKGDSLDYKVKEYFLDGRVEEIYFLKDGKREGYNIGYYNNGKPKFEGQWVDDKMLGDFKTYYSSGELESIINYIPFRDTNINRPNQGLKFSREGDTLWDQSMYYVIRKISHPNDTVKFGELYVFDIELKGHVFDSTTFINVCNFDSVYNFIPGKPHYITTLVMKNSSIGMGAKADKYGWNYIRGFIENTTWSSASPHLPVTKVELYFTDSFYVEGNGDDG